MQYVNHFKLFFILLPFFYSFFYAPYGFEDFDTGFILGLSWQYYIGSIPYLDIIYVRPPISYIFHSLFLFLENYAVIFNRAFFYFQVFIYSYLSILLLSKQFNFLDKRFIYFLSSLAFILSVHNFPPMPWHTTDGVLFIVLGSFLIILFNNWFPILIGSFFITLGILTKQPFYLFPLLILGYLLIIRNYKKFIFTFVGMLIFLSIFFLYLYNNHSFSEFIIQTTGVTKISDLFYAGVLSYIKGIKYFIFIFIPPLILSLLIYIFFSKNISYIYITLLWILFFSLFNYTKANSFSPFSPFVYSYALFIFSLLYTLYKLYKTRDNIWYIVLLFLSLSWIVSISWGYNAPVLFSIPMIFITGIFIKEDFKLHIRRYFFLLLFAIFTFFIGYQHPYNLAHQVKRSELIYDMSIIFPKLKFIYADKKTFLEYKELKSLIKKYGNSFTVLPNVTLIHYLSNTKNPIGIDWVMNAEIDNKYYKIINTLDSNNVIVFIPKTIKLHEKGKFGSKVTFYVIRNWKKLEEKEFFEVYMKPPVNNLTQ